MRPAAGRPRRRPGRAATALTLGAALVCGCGSSSDPAPIPVTTGTIDGLAFTVVAGNVFQDVADGAVRSDAVGATLVFDEDPAGLGMTDPDQLQLRTRFAAEPAGVVTVIAFGTPGDPHGSGLAAEIRRVGDELSFVLELSGSVFANGTFAASSAGPDAEHWVVTEFYAQNVPGYGGSRSGITMWDLDDLTAEFSTDLLGCSAGPAMQQVPLTGDRVAYFLQSARIVSVEVVDEIIGPCE